ncbi:MAG TPA: hypothetical protein VFV19_13485 [Candidatus Polarisedimenticolaceae bacterium]|nr:hypothetical protein [Candidatus Polarisedimenticolaceae bacterium]
MNRKRRVIAVALPAVALMFAAANAADVVQSGPPSSTNYLFCTASSTPSPNDPAKRSVTYFSAAFAAEAQSLGPVSEAFLKYLESKYAFKPQPDNPQPVACTSLHSFEEAQNLEKARQRKAGLAGQIVETGWTYTPAAPAR